MIVNVSFLKILVVIQEAIYLAEMKANVAKMVNVIVNLDIQDLCVLLVSNCFQKVKN